MIYTQFIQSTAPLELTSLIPIESFVSTMSGFPATDVI